MSPRYSLLDHLFNLGCYDAVCGPPAASSSQLVFPNPPNCVYSQWMCAVRFSSSALLWLTFPRFPFRIATMIAGKRLADIGYRTFSASMMLLTVYGGYLCTLRGYRYMQRQKELKLAAENQDAEVLKDWPNGPHLFLPPHVDIFHPCVCFHTSLRGFLCSGCKISLQPRTLAALMVPVKSVLAV